MANLYTGALDQKPGITNNSPSVRSGTVSASRSAGGTVQRQPGKSQTLLKQNPGSALAQNTGAPQVQTQTQPRQVQPSTIDFAQAAQAAQGAASSAPSYGGQGGAPGGYSAQLDAASQQFTQQGQGQGTVAPPPQQDPKQQAAYDWALKNGLVAGSPNAKGDAAIGQASAQQQIQPQQQITAQVQPQILGYDPTSSVFADVGKQQTLGYDPTSSVFADVGKQQTLGYDPSSSVFQPQPERQVLGYDPTSSVFADVGGGGGGGSGGGGGGGGPPAPPPAQQQEPMSFPPVQIDPVNQIPALPGTIPQDQNAQFQHEKAPIGTIPTMPLPGAYAPGAAAQNMPGAAPIGAGGGAVPAPATPAAPAVPQETSGTLASYTNPFKDAYQTYADQITPSMTSFSEEPWVQGGLQSTQDAMKGLGQVSGASYLSKQNPATQMSYQQAAAKIGAKGESDAANLGRLASGAAASAGAQGQISAASELAKQLAENELTAQNLQLQGSTALGNLGMGAAKTGVQGANLADTMAINLAGEQDEQRRAMQDQRMSETSNMLALAEWMDQAGWSTADIQKQMANLAGGLTQMWNPYYVDPENANPWVVSSGNYHPFTMGPGDEWSITKGGGSNQQASQPVTASSEGNPFPYGSPEWFTWEGQNQKGKQAQQAQPAAAGIPFKYGV